MRCDNCGFNVPDGYEICPNCHKTLNTTEEVKDFGTIDNTSFKDDKLDLEQYIRNPKNKKKVPLIFTSIIMAIVILIILFGILFINKKDTKNYYIKFIDDFFEAFDTSFITSSTNAGDYKLIYETDEKTYKVSGSYEYDIKEHVASISASMDDPIKKEESIILESNDLSLNLYMQNNKVYLVSEDIYARPITFNFEDHGAFTSKFNEKAVIYSIQNALDEGAGYKATTKEKTSISFHGERLDLKKETMKLDKRDAQKAIQEIADTMNEDYTLLNELVRMTSLSKEDIKAAIEDISNKLKYDYVPNNYLTAEIYYKKNNIYRLTIDVNGYVLTLDHLDDNYYLTLTNYGTTVIDANLNVSTGVNDKGETKNYVLSCKYKDKQYDVSLSLSNMRSEKVAKKEIINTVSYADLSEEERNSIKNNLGVFFDEAFNPLLDKFNVDYRCYKKNECTCDETICRCGEFSCPIDVINKKDGVTDEV